MDKNYLVTKSNELIAAHYNLSLEEQRIILTLASMVQPNDAEFKPYKFSIKAFIDALGIKTKTKYQEIPKITKELMKKVFEIKAGSKTIQLSWISSVQIEPGTVEICFDPKLKPYMLKLNELYTSYKLVNVLSLKSKYSIRIYEILKSHEFKKQGYAIIDLQELRLMLGVKDEEYLRYFDFKKYVLNQSQKELEEKTDICFTFEEIRVGRKIKSIKFFIKSNKSPESDELAIDSVKKSSRKSKGNFNNFEQRDYNYDELEKKLLGWE